MDHALLVSEGQGLDHLANQLQGQGRAKSAAGLLPRGRQVAGQVPARHVLVDQKRRMRFQCVAVQPDDSIRPLRALNRHEPIQNVPFPVKRGHHGGIEAKLDGARRLVLLEAVLGFVNGAETADAQQLFELIRGSGQLGADRKRRHIGRQQANPGALLIARKSGRQGELTGVLIGNESAADRQGKGR